MKQTTLTPKPTVWAEFVILTGSDDSPHIHARLSTDKGFELISALLDESGTVGAAQESFRKQMAGWVRRA